MRRKALKRLCLVCLVLVFVSLGYSLVLRRLSVEQTLGLACSNPHHGFSENLYSRSHPSARDGVYRILNDEKMQDCRWNAIRVLGSIGGKPEADYICAKLERQVGMLNQKEVRATRAMLVALATLSRRGVPNATESLKRYSSTTFIEKMSFRCYDDSKSVGWSAELEFASWCFHARVIAGHSLVEDREKILATIKDVQSRQELSRRIGIVQSRIAWWTKRVSEWHPTSPRTLWWLAQSHHQYIRRFSEGAPADSATSTTQFRPVDSTDDVERAISEGDASVVPQLRQWLEMEDYGSPKLWLSVEGLAKFGDRKSLARLKAIADDPSITLPLRQRAACGVARIYGKDDVEALKKMVWDDQLPLAGRSEAALRLWQLHDELGAQFLLEQYDLYRLERKTTNPWQMDCVRDALKRIDDKDIIAALNSRLSTETDGRMQNNIRTLVDRMRMNSEPIDRLKELAADATWTNAGKRYEAIEVLGYNGSPDLIPFIESLSPFVGDSIPPLQKQVFRDEVNTAIGRIRRRHWNKD